MTPGFDPLNIILLAVAIIIFWRLKVMLGQRTGTEKPPLDLGRLKETPRPETDNVIQLPGQRSAPESNVPVWKGHAAEGSETAKGLEAIAALTKDFNTAQFMSGAKSAYEMILEAFAASDRQALKPLLSKEVFESFTAALDERAKLGQSMVFQFVGVKSADLGKAVLAGKRAQLTIRFRSDMISALTNKDGTIAEGDPKAVQDVSDLWTFERDTQSKDPNWKLVATDDDPD